MVLHLLIDEILGKIASKLKFNIPGMSFVMTQFAILNIASVRSFHV